MSLITTVLPEVKTATLRERPELPVGVKVGDTVHRQVAVRPWRMAEERALGELRDKNRDANVSSYASIVLASMCTRLGPWDFSEVSFAERRALISGLTMPDVFLAYVFLRVEAMGPMFKMEVTCQRCMNEFPFTVNLDETEVRYIEDPDRVFWEYELRAPFEARGRKIEAFRMGPTRWASMEATPPGSLNLGIAKGQIIQGSLYGFPGQEGELVLAGHELDQLAKRDIEALTNQLDELSLGPDMSIVGACPRCSRRFRESIDWSHEAFFGTSSQ